MEGCLVVVEKKGDGDSGHVVYLETLRHNTITKYDEGKSDRDSEKLRVEDGHPLLYVEPKGHGILALTSEKQTAGKDVLIYSFKGRADDPQKIEGSEIGFELLPIRTTLWARARDGVDATYGQVEDFGEIAIKVKQAENSENEWRTPLRKIGIAFVGKVGGINMARPPWGWFDRSRREETLGVWYFDPAQTIKRDFKLDESFSTAYVRVPFWANGGKASTEKSARVRKR
jgi:hypothetical protein